MKKTLIASGSLLGLFVLLFIVSVSMWVSYNNQATRLKNTIEAKQKDNENQLSKLDNVLGTQGEVLQEQKKAVMEVASKYASARGSSGGSLMKWIQEAIPNLDQSTYKVLLNSITAENTGFAFHQTEILDYQREYNNLVDTWPSGLFVSVLGKHQHMNVVVVTSSDAQKAFNTGTYNRKPLFQNDSTAEKQ
jgi:hypothetical protein